MQVRNWNQHSRCFSSVWGHGWEEWWSTWVLKSARSSFTHISGTDGGILGGCCWLLLLTYLLHLDSLCNWDFSELGSWVIENIIPQGSSGEYFKAPSRIHTNLAGVISGNTKRRLLPASTVSSTSRGGEASLLLLRKADGNFTLTRPDHQHHYSCALRPVVK